MDFAVLQPRHPMVHAAGQFADFGMQRAAKGDVHLLQATANPEQRHAAGDAGLRYRQRDLVAMDVVGFVLGIRLGIEARGVNVGPRPGQHNAVDHVQQGADVGDLGRAGEHQRKRAGDVRHRAEIAFTDHLRRETIFKAMGVADHADHGPSHNLRLAQEESFLLGTIPGRSCL